MSNATQLQKDTGHVHGPNCSHDHDHDHCGHNHTIVRSQPKIGRNEPCPCQSGKKYKKCCNSLQV